MTEGARKVLDYLKNHFGEEKTKQDIAADLGVSVNTVTGSVRGLVTKGRAAERAEEITDDNGKAKTVKYVTLTEDGLNFDPDAEVAKKDKE